MPGPRELDSVIREADAKTPVDASCQVLVPIDQRTGRPASQGLWSALGKQHRKHFLVTNTNRLEATAVRRNLKIPIEDFEHEWRFDLFLDYEARCPPGREIRVAQALWQPNPQDRFEGLLKGWVLQLLDGRAAEAVRSFDRSRESLAQDLRSRALEHTGLALTVRLRLADADRLDPLCIGPLDLTIRVRDSDDEIEIRFEAELAVESGKERIAYLHRERLDLLDKEVRRRAREYFARSVSLQQLHAELSGRIQSDLQRHLEDVVEPYGRKVERLHLAGDALPGVAESRRIEHLFTHRLADYPDPVQVRADLLLQLVDLGRYVRAKSPDLEAWVRREVEEVSTQCLFKVTYAELCLSFDEKKAEIEQRMKERAATTGYELKQLITITDLQLDVLRKPFLVHLDGEFATRLARQKVKLEIDATVVIPHPSEIARLLNQRVDVTQQIRETIGNRIQQKLHQIDPEHFYMEYEVVRVDDRPDCEQEGERAAERRPVREQLETLVRSCIETEFHAEVLGLSCKQLDTQLSQILERLLVQPHRFEVKVVASQGGPPVTFEGSLRVNGVDEKGWLPFQTSAPEPQELCDCAARHLEFKLADIPLKQLLQTKNKDQFARVNKLVQDCILAEYGLRIVLRDWIRRPLEEEKSAAQAQLDMAMDTIEEQRHRVEVAKKVRLQYVAMKTEAAEERVKQIKMLQERLCKLSVDDNPEREIEIREQIAGLEAAQKDALREATDERSINILPHLRTARGILVAGEESPEGPFPEKPSQE